MCRLSTDEVGLRSRFRGVRINLFRMQGGMLESKRLLDGAKSNKSSDIDLFVIDGEVFMFSNEKDCFFFT